MIESDYNVRVLFMINTPKNYLFPPIIIYKRIEISLKTFFEDLEVFCKKSNWRYDPPKCMSDGKRSHWKNNLVEIKQIEEFPDGRAKGFIMTYHVPSFIGSPLNKKKAADLDTNPPALGYKHEIYVALPANYPSVKSIESSQKRSDALYIESRSQLFHPRFYLRRKSWGCIMVNGEIDRIAMNLLQQLLWEPSHVWKDAGEYETTNNVSASNLAKELGKQEVYNYLLEKMKVQWGLT